MAMQYFVTVSDRTDIRQGWRVSCFGLPDDNWNALGHSVAESTHRTKAAADKKADELAKAWGAKRL